MPDARGALLLAVAAVLLAGTGGIFYFGSPTETRLTLRKGETASIHPFRLAPQRGEYFLVFKREYPKPRPELGHLSSQYAVKDGLRDLTNPGPRIQVEVATERGRTVMEALPAVAGDTESWIMELVPHIPHADPRTVAWPPDESRIPSVSAGLSEVRVQVISVERVEGETVTFGMVAPMSRRNMFVQGSYALFLWFQFWQLNLVIAAVCFTNGLKRFRKSAGAKAG